MDPPPITGEIVLRNTKHLMSRLMFGTTGGVEVHVVLVPGGVRVAVVLAEEVSMEICRGRGQGDL